MEASLIRTFMRPALESLLNAEPLRGPFTREQIRAELARRDDLEQKRYYDPHKYRELSHS